MTGKSVAGVASETKKDIIFKSMSRRRSHKARKLIHDLELEKSTNIF